MDSRKSKDKRKAKKTRDRSNGLGPVPQVVRDPLVLLGVP